MCMYVFLCGEREREHDSFFKTQDWKFNLEDVYPILQTPQISQGPCLIPVSIKQKFVSAGGFTHCFYLTFPKEPVPYLPQPT